MLSNKRLNALCGMVLAGLDGLVGAGRRGRL